VAVLFLSILEVESRWAEIESAVDQTPEIDPWCSAPDWFLSVRQGFGCEIKSKPLAVRFTTGRGPGFALLARYQSLDGQSVDEAPTLAGLEPMWGFASPLIGADIDSVAAQLAALLAEDDDWGALVLPGMPIPVDNSSFTARVARGLSVLGPVRAGEGMVRQVADLGSGLDAWLAARSRRFRQRLRQAEQRAATEGLTFSDLGADDKLLPRLLAIEQTSWKGQEDSGISSPEMAAVYGTMIERLRSRGRLRVHVARLAGADVGYILGGVRNGRYRGLQISYHTEVADLSVGHLLQWHQIKQLNNTAEAAVYDLGMDLEYKRRWADRAEASLTLVVQRG